jgi:hypothetical protein
MSKPFVTSTRADVTPLASSDFTAIDEGISLGHRVWLMNAKTLWRSAQAQLLIRMYDMLYRELQPEVFQDHHIQHPQL